MRQIPIEQVSQVKKTSSPRPCQEKYQGAVTAKAWMVPKYHTLSGPNGDVAAVVSSLNAQGYWLAPLGYTSNPYKADGTKAPQPGDYWQTYVGDASDTSPYPDPKLMGISTEAYIRNMSVLIRSLQP